MKIFLAAVALVFVASCGHKGHHGDHQHKSKACCAEQMKEGKKPCCAEKMKEGKKACCMDKSKEAKSCEGDKEAGMTCGGDKKKSCCGGDKDHKHEG